MEEHAQSCGNGCPRNTKGQCPEKHPQSPDALELSFCSYHPEVDWTRTEYLRTGSVLISSSGFIDSPSTHLTGQLRRRCHLAGFLETHRVSAQEGSGSCSLGLLSGPEGALLLQASS